MLIRSLICLALRMLRVLMDSTGKDLSALLDIEKLSKLLQKVPRNNAQNLVRHARPKLIEMLQGAEAKALPQQEALIAAAQQHVTQEINDELARMKALAKVNPNVRESEIVYLQQRLTLSLQYISQAKLRLDSLRVIMTI